MAVNEGTIQVPDLGKLDEKTLAAIELLASTDEKSLRFFFRAPKDEEYVNIVRPSLRCVTERRGFLHQYRKNGNGDWQLDSGLKAPTIREIGDGMYILPDGHFTQLPPKLEFRNKEDFMVHCSIPPL